MEARATRMLTSPFVIGLAPGGETSPRLPPKTERGGCPGALRLGVLLGETPAEPPGNPLPHSRSERVGDPRHEATGAVQLLLQGVGSD